MERLINAAVGGIGGIVNARGSPLDRGTAERVDGLSQGSGDAAINLLRAFREGRRRRKRDSFDFIEGLINGAVQVRKKKEKKCKYKKSYISHFTSVA